MSKEQTEEAFERENTQTATTRQARKAVAKEGQKSLHAKPKPAGSDAYIRVLMGIAALAIIGALLTIIFAYLAGIIDFDQQGATTLEEFTVARSLAYAEAERTAGAMSQLAIAQIAGGQYSAALATIEEAYSLNLPDEERNQGTLFARATLALHQGNEELAIELYEEVMERLLDDFTRVFESDMEPNWAQAFGMHHNYFETALVLSFLYHDRGDYDLQLEMLDEAIEGMSTNADVFVFRGFARLDQGDTAGAIEDFNEALRFIPDDERALTGLEEAGGN